MSTNIATPPVPRRSPEEKQDPKRMREMFTTISPRYDLFTRTFSFGMDGPWKRAAFVEARLPAGALVLDLASGTGDFTRLIEGRVPGARSVAVDLTHLMLSRARRQGVVRAVCGDAMRLPFRDGEFDAVFVGYGMRNFPRLGEALQEIHRVLKPGGCLVSLDFFLPKNSLWREVFVGYLWVAGGVFGQLLHGKPSIYTYISKSLRDFMTMEEHQAELRNAGFRLQAARRFLFGGIGLHWAVRA